jgi:hypothetical protein
MGKVYRIENRSKNGPYRSNRCKNLDVNITERHPSFRGDSLLMTRSKNKPSIFDISVFDERWVHLKEESSRFAFSTIQQLRFWFHNDEELKEMNKHRFQVVIYEVNRSHCVRGRTQCIFNKNHAKKIGTISLLKFLSENT